MKYDQSTVRENIYITDGMMNSNPSKAYSNLSSQIRSEIQQNAVENQLNEDKDYFKQFGCDKETAAAIVSWFNHSKDYTLHETKMCTVQIMDSKIHSSVYHDGGVSQEKSDMLSADKRDN